MKFETKWVMRVYMTDREVSLSSVNNRDVHAMKTFSDEEDGEKWAAKICESMYEERKNKYDKYRQNLKIFSDYVSDPNEKSFYYTKEKIYEYVP